MIKIAPGMLPEDPPQTPEPKDGRPEAEILAEAMAAERAKPIGDRPEGGSVAEEGPAGVLVRPDGPEAQAARKKDLAAIDSTGYGDMRNVPGPGEAEGRPVFSEEELAFIAKTGGARKKLSKADDARRTSLLDRASKWRQRRRAELEAEWTAREKAALEGAQRAARLEALVEITGREPWESWNDLADLASAFVDGGEAFVFTSSEIAILEKPSREVLLKYPRLAAFLAMINMPEVRLLRAMRPMMKAKVEAFFVLRAKIKDERARRKDGKDAIGPEPSRN